MLLYRAKKLYFMFFLSLLMGMTLLGCAAEKKSQSELRSDGNFSAPLPKSLNAANVTESNLIVEIIIDPEKEPQDRRRLQNLVVDSETKAFSGEIQGAIPAGPHTFRLVFTLDDPTYGEIEVAVSGDVAVEVIANEDTPVDFGTAAMIFTDTDGDSRTNLEELERGWDPKLVAPAAPQNISAILGDQEVTLSWDAVVSADSYTIYWNTNSNVTTGDPDIAGLTETSFVHTGRTNGTTYRYIVTAVGLGGESASSPEISGVPNISLDAVQKVFARDAQASDQLGFSVSISGDYAIVGAAREDGGDGDPLFNAGAVYIFWKNESNMWDSGTKITAPDAQAGDLFGFFVSISGDYAIVGSPGEDGGDGSPLSSAGAAYIFHRTGSNIWDGGTKITVPDAQAGDLFGWSVSITDGAAIVGANRVGSGSSTGAAYIFERSGTTIWDNGTKITSPDAIEGGFFGSSVSIDGEYATVGAPGDIAGGGIAGAAYVFRRLGANNWGDGRKLSFLNNRVGDLFGKSVSISGDSVIVGVPSGTGSAYVFQRIGINMWDSGIGLTAPDAQLGDAFGSSVSISENRAVIGADRDDGVDADLLVFSGSAYVFQRTGGNIWDGITKITAPDAQIGDQFGFSVSINGDYTIVGAIGAIGENGGDGNPLDNAGASYIYY